ncbi:hypothetical protein [Lentilactobacillus parabuchneri]|uniref:hypothetical protein n=1 Tax=Lentilactobacillus parabuchneri TaxID=152331 RepID=UPI0022356A30|nr:hypothetical protein [Lentilactobacillus parabuchneri]
MIHHYMTEYRNGKNEVVFESWIQLNFLGLVWCYSVKSFILNPDKDNPMRLISS